MSEHAFSPLAALRVWRIIFVLYAVALTISTHWPRLNLGTEEHDSPDKLVHMLAFGGFTLLLWRTQWLANRWLLLIVVLLWSALDEWTQGLPGLHRTPNIADVAANWLGIILVFTWIQTLRPIGGPLNRLRQKRFEFLLDILTLRRQTWLFVGAIAGGASAIVCLGAAAITYYVNPQLLFHGGVLGLAAGGGAGLFAALDYRWRHDTPGILDMKPCFACGAFAQDASFDEHGFVSCASCGIALHEAQWSVSLDMPRARLTRSAIPASGAAILLAFGLLIVYGLLFLGTLQFAAVRSRIVHWFPMDLRIAIDLALIGLILAGAFRVFRRNVARAFDVQGTMCRHCGHNLTRTDSERGTGRCGECGTLFIRLPDNPPPLAGSRDAER